MLKRYSQINIRPDLFRLIRIHCADFKRTQREVIGEAERISGKKSWFLKLVVEIDELVHQPVRFPIK